MSIWERKFGKFAIRNLTIVLLGCYMAGYVIQLLMPALFYYLTLDPYAILSGQIWRLVTWVLIPPMAYTNFTDIFFIAIMLLFYFSLGTSLERIWGTWQYNVYIFRGLLLTIVASFLCCAAYLLVARGMAPEMAKSLFANGSLYFSTYYINMSIFLAYALTFSDARVLFMMFIPVKVKWLGIIYLVMLTFQMVESFLNMDWFTVAAIGASLLNFLILWIQSRGHVHLGPKQMKRRAEFKSEVRKNTNIRISKHKCAICGRTDTDNPELYFRFCSKCNGNYEYCQDHLFTHTHIK